MGVHWIVPLRSDDSWPQRVCNCDAMLTHTEIVRTNLSMRETRGRICRFMTGAGYEVIGTEHNILFDRGQSFGTLPGSPPRAWTMRVFAHLMPDPNGTKVMLRWEMGSASRLMAVWDVGYLREEVQAAVATIRGQNVNMSDLDRVHVRAGLLSLGLYVASFLTVGVTGVLAATGEVPVTAWLLAILIVAMLFLTVRAPMLENPRREPTG
jgi:hypothetical protein